MNVCFMESPKEKIGSSFVRIDRLNGKFNQPFEVIYNLVVVVAVQNIHRGIFDAILLQHMSVPTLVSI